MLNLIVFNVRESDIGRSMDEFELPVLLHDDPSIIDSGFDPTEEMIYPVWVELMGQYPYGYRADDNIPADIVQSLKEAGNCLSVGATNAVAVMCGRVLENLVVYFGIGKEDLRTRLNRLRDEGHLDDVAYSELSSEETLYNQIEHLKGSGKLYDLLYEALSEIRRWRNRGAHNDKDDRITQNEAKQLVELVTRIVQHIFETDSMNHLTRQLSDQRKSTDS